MSTRSQAWRTLNSTAELSHVVLRAQVVLALLFILVLVLVLIGICGRASMLAISMLVPLLHAAPADPGMRSAQSVMATPTVGYLRSASPWGKHSTEMEALEEQVRVLTDRLDAHKVETKAAFGYASSGSGSPSGRRQGKLHRARSRARAPVAVTYGRRRPMMNRSGELSMRRRSNHSGEPMQPRGQPYDSGGGEPPYVGELHRPIDEAALLAYALQVYREPPPPGLSVLNESRRWTWWWSGRPFQVILQLTLTLT